MKDIRFAAVILAGLTAAAAFGQSVPGATQRAAALPPSGPVGFFSLSQIHKGLHGTAYTVFEGTTPEPMGVEILGVLHDALGPKQDMILARLTGTKPEYTGVVAGMSGSPVYIDGKLVGALAYRIGEFSKEPIAGITPIEEMLQVLHPERLDAKLPGEELPGGAGTGNGPIVQAGQAAGETGAGTPLIAPMDTPLVFSGFSQQALDLWKEHTPGLTMAAASGVGGSDPMARDGGPVIPGSAISAVLVKGDLDIAATCTVTYVDPKRLLACGHPLTQFGAVSMPMTKAEVVATLPSPLNAFKIINTTQTVGAFTQDRETAIAGVFGQSARMIPVHVRVVGAQTRDLNLEVIDQPQITPAAVMVSVFQGLMQANGYSAETTYRVRGAIRLKGYPELTIANLVAPTEAAPANLVTALVVGDRFSRLYENAARRTPIEGVDLEIDAIPQRLTVQLESAQATVPHVHAGQTVTIEATVRPYHGVPKNVELPVTLPAVLPDGPVRLLVSDGGTLDRLTQPIQLGGQPLDISATIAQLNGVHAADRLYVTLLAPQAQASVEGRTLAALPISMANVLEPLKENRGVALNGESAIPMMSLPMGAVVSGQQVVTLNVE